MEVVICDSAGFCGGVRRAIRLANSLVDCGFRVYTEGSLVHNHQVVNALRRRGIIEIDREDAPPINFSSAPHAFLPAAKKACILIRAHGISQQRRTQLQQNLSLPLYDATCPCVSQIAQRISDYSRRGYYVAFFGEKTHPESLGIISYAGDRGCIFSAVEELDLLPLNGRVPVLFSQTTADISEFENIAAYFAKKFPNADIVNSVCAATRQRQKELSKLLIPSEIDGVVVVGGRHSSNTQKLYKRAGEVIERTFLIESVAELQSCDLSHCRRILLTGGASTPPKLIASVARHLRRLP